MFSTVKIENGVILDGKKLKCVKSYKLEQKLDSREVAEMVGKAHDKLLRDIRTYIEQLSLSKIGESDFFVESKYKNERGKEYPCYLITKEGCEFIAHKLTGVKGT